MGKVSKVKRIDIADMRVLMKYVLLQTCCAFFGLSSAALGTMVPIVILDILGPDSMANGYGNLMLFEAIGQVSGAPVASKHNPMVLRQPFWIFGINKIIFVINSLEIESNHRVIDFIYDCHVYGPNCNVFSLIITDYLPALLNL